MFDLPQLDVSGDFRTITAMSDARGRTLDRPLGTLPPGAQLDAIREAVPDLRASVIASGHPVGVTTCDLVTFPYPTRFGLWRATNAKAPYLWMTNRMLVIQWDDADGRSRTLLWEASDHELGGNTPFFARLQAETPIPQRLLRTVHGTVLGHLRALGIDPADVDYIAFDHLHTQDVRRLIGTTRPAPDLGSPDRPVEPWFPNAQLITQAGEWEAIRHLHPLQAPWYQPETYLDLPHDRLLAVDGDVQLGPGVALVTTPGHTLGNQSLVLHTSEGIWTSSENGIAADSYAPRLSKLSGLRRFVEDWGQEVIMNANTIELAAWQHDSMILESLLADPVADGRFPRCFPTSELTAHPAAPGLAPTHTFGGIEHGSIRGSSVVGTR